MEYIYHAMTKILYAGRISPIKDVNTLKKAVKILGLKLLIKNSYAYRDVAKVLREGDIIVVPTLSKSLDKVFLEGLACGVPTIGTDVGYPFMKDKFPELIYNAGDDADLARKITWLIDHPQKTKEITLKARKFVKDNYDLDQLMTKIYDQFSLA